MSDQDFFFDDEPKAEAPKKADKAAPKKSGSKPVAKKSAPAAAAPAVASDFSSVSMTICALIAIIALLIGLIGGLFIGKSLTPPVVSGPTDTGIPAMGGSGMGGTTAPEGMGTTDGDAPVLTDDQIEGGMPAGHPPLEEDAEGGAADDTKSGDTKTEGTEESK